jgi:hypothetical protein
MAQVKPMAEDEETATARYIASNISATDAETDLRNHQHNVG